MSGLSVAGLARFASELGVSAASLGRLGSKWSWEHKAWAFPMRATNGTILGVRLRGLDGRKWAVVGSRQGLFIPDGGQLGDQ